MTCPSNTLRPILLALGAALAAYAAPSVAASGYEAEIRRTSYGIPHIKAKDEAGLGYGIGYAYAQDNICLLADEMLTVNGMRSEFFGPDIVGGPDVDSGFNNSTNRTSDLFFKLINSEARVDAAWKQQKAEVKALLNGYAAGYNRYLSDAGRNGLPEACRDAPWVRPITALDLVKLFRRYEIEFSSMLFMDGLVAARPGSASPGASAGQQVDSAAIWRPHGFGFGSNAVALGKDATDNGRGLLLGNPHYPWHGTLRFYQLHLTIPGKLDSMGVALPGLPAVIIGFTRNFAWSHTVNTSAHFTLYALELDPRDPTRYRVGDRWERMTKEPVRIRAKDRNGVLTTVSHDFWFSVYGPVLTRPGGLEWTDRTAFAIRDANLANNRMLQTWHEMGRSRSLEDVEGAVKSALGLPWINTVAADRQGRALYLNVTPVPNVPADKQERCIAEPYRTLIADDLYILSGSDPACAWDIDAAAPRAGIVAGDRLPTLWRTDYVQNSNDSAWMTNPASPLTGFAPTISRAGEELGGRTRIGIAQIQARLAGTDGLPGNKFTMKLLQDISFNNRVFYAAVTREDLGALCDDDASPVTLDGRSVDLGEACETLRKWDGTAGIRAVGYPLFAAWWDRIEENEAIWAVPFSAEDPVNTPRGVKRSDPAVARFVREALAGAILELEKAGVDWKRPWGEIQFVKAGNRHVPIPGGSKGRVYNNIYSVPAAEGRSVRIGSSYVQTVGFDEHGPVADAVLAYSQSTDPQSPHYRDQLDIFSAGKWIRQPFLEEQIMADPAYSTMVISE